MLGSQPIEIDGSTIYLLVYQNNHVLRYEEGGKCLTTDSHLEDLPNPWLNWIPAMLRLVLGPKLYVVDLKSPICWDNDKDEVRLDKLRQITSRIERAVESKYKACRIEIEQHPV